MTATDPSSVVTGGWRALGTERFELAEGVRIVDDRALFVDLLAGRLLQVDPTAPQPPTEVLVLDEPLGAVAPARAGGFVAAAGTGVARMSESGNPTWLSHPADLSDVSLRVNDATADRSGRFWVSSMAWDNTPGAGALYRVDPDGAVTTVVQGLTIPNGPAFSPDGRTMYLADTARSAIYAYPLDPVSGELGSRRTFAEVDGNPDGMTVDSDGFLWSAIWGGGCLHRYAPDGRLAEAIAVPARQPTSVALTPQPPYLVVVTTAVYDLPDPKEHDGHVIVAPVGVAGLDTAAFG